MLAALVGGSWYFFSAYALCSKELGHKVTASLERAVQAKRDAEAAARHAEVEKSEAAQAMARTASQKSADAMLEAQAYLKSARDLRESPSFSLSCRD